MGAEMGAEMGVEMGVTPVWFFIFKEYNYMVILGNSNDFK